MKILIVQDEIGIDGRSKVISEMIHSLHENGVKAELWSFSGKKKLERFCNSFSLSEVMFSYKEIAYGLVSLISRSTLIKGVLISLYIKGRVEQYDCVLVSTNSLISTSARYLTIHYVHFPIIANLKSNKRINTTWHGRAYKRALMKILSMHKPSDDDVYICNSNFTQQVLIENYHGMIDVDEVIYPPVDINGFKVQAIKDLGVVTLGAFGNNKNQMEQLRIAKELPEIDFHIIGTMASKTYFNKCKEFASRNKIQNVSFYPDASKEKVGELLARSKIFLHTMKNEPFGIATVEAIAHGCLPIVNDSGGQKEIVFVDYCRFADLTQAAQKIRYLISNDDALASYVGELVGVIDKYCASTFKKNIWKMINNRFHECL